MFIRVNGVEYNIAHIKSYQNLWKKVGKGHEKNGSVIEMIDGERIAAVHHVEIEEKQIEPTIIPAQEGYEIIIHCENDAKEIEFFFEPVIAWKIDCSYVTPISPHTSWEDFNNSMHSVFREIKTGVIHSSSQAWESLEAYKTNLLTKGQ